MMVALSSRDKVTIFLSLLGPEVAAQVLKYLPEELARIAASGIERLPLPPAEAVQSVLEEFNNYYLTRAEEKKALTGPLRRETASDPLEIAIRRVGPGSFWKILAGEDLTTVAFLLANFSSALRQALLGVLDNGQRQTITNLLGQVKRTTLTGQIMSAFKEYLTQKLSSN